MTRKDWEPMTLQQVGTVGELMRLNLTGSRRDNNVDCAVGRQNDAGQKC